MDTSSQESLLIAFSHNRSSEDVVSARVEELECVAHSHLLSDEMIVPKAHHFGNSAVLNFQELPFDVSSV